MKEETGGGERGRVATSVQDIGSEGKNCRRCVGARSLVQPTGTHIATESPSLCIPLTLSIGGLPSSAIPYSLSLPPDLSEPTRCTRSSGGEKEGERRGLKEEEENATRNARKRHREKRRARKREKSGKIKRKERRRDAHKASSGTIGSLEFPFRSTVLTLLIPMIFSR